MAEVPTLTDAVVGLAKQYGWLVFRVRQWKPGWNLGSGFPDLVLAREGRLMFVELKRQDGRPDARQQLWLDTLATVTTVQVWRPSDLRTGYIERSLR